MNNFKDLNGNWAKLLYLNGVQYRTDSGSVWYDMSTRCDPLGSLQKRLPRYVGCAMSDEFANFQIFVEWHQKQIGFGIEGYELDKDILFEGNKLYSSKTCVLVPKSLNMFFVAHNAGRGPWPQGVFLDKRRGKFQARFNNKGLGSYYTPEQAHTAFCVAKEAEARRWSKRLEAGEFVVDQRVIERLKVWAVPVEEAL